MEIGVIELTDRIQSGKEIYKSSKKYRDLGFYVDTTLTDFFDFVKNIPYQEDRIAEIVSRPKYLFDRNKFPGLDCKKKAILIGAWLTAHGIKWRAVAASERADKKIHHVFIQAYIKGRYRNIDATYPYMRLFESKPKVTRAQELPR